MKKSDLNFIVDAITFTVLVLLIPTGYIMKYILPPGSGRRQMHGDNIETLLSLGRHEWGRIHFYLAVTFVSAIAIHFFLHFTWIKNYCANLFNAEKKQ